MAANQAPIFTGTPKRGRVVWLPATTANVKSDGAGTIGTDILLLATAGANGSFLTKVRLHPSGGTAATATTATVGRVYISSASSGATTSANTSLLGEVACPAQTTDQTTTATTPIDIPIGQAIAGGESVLFSMHHAAAANTAWHVQLFYGDY